MDDTRKSFEVRAAQLASAELLCDVVVHDDGSANSMYDLRIGPASAPQIAIECIGAVDPVRTETWNAGLAGGDPIVSNVRGDWGVSIRPDASLKRLRSGIGSLLQTLEDLGLDGVDAGYQLRRAYPEIAEKCRLMGVSGIRRVREDGSGEVYQWMDGIGGAVNTSGDGVAEWIEEFLADPDRADVLHKLEQSGAEQREVFIAVSFGGAPWKIESYLRDESRNLPSASPRLPDEVTGVWLVGASKRLRYTSEGWSHFAEGVD